MTAEGNHEWGCGYLNDTGPCTCGEVWTAESTVKDATKKASYLQGAERMVSGSTMRESLQRLDKIAQEIKNQE